MIVVEVLPFLETNRRNTQNLITGDVKHAVTTNMYVRMTLDLHRSWVREGLVVRSVLKKVKSRCTLEFKRGTQVQLYNSGYKSRAAASPTHRLTRSDVYSQ